MCLGHHCAVQNITGPPPIWTFVVAGEPVYCECRQAQGRARVHVLVGDILHMPQTNAARPKHPRTHYFVASGLFDRLEDFADLEARIANLPIGDCGHAFEVFAEAYLATQKIVGAEEVWPADQVPITVLKACRLPVKVWVRMASTEPLPVNTTRINRSSARGDRR